MPLLLTTAAVGAVAWVYLLLGHGWYWRTDQRLPSAAPPAAPPPAAWPAVVAIVPARNEAAILPETLPGLLDQDYPGRFRVVLVDDESSDGTGQVAGRLGALCIPGEPLPPGWAGKVWAMEQGARTAAAKDADYLLFTDADIGFAPGTITRLVRAAHGNGLALLSQMARLRGESRAERLLVPAFVYFFALLYPFRRVNSPASRTAAAAGGCMLVRRQALDAAGGLGRIRGARIDDVALGRLMKQNAGPCWLGFTAEVVSRRRYDDLPEVWDMVARSAYTQLRYSPAALAGTVVGLAWLFLLPVAATVTALTAQSIWLAAAGLAAWTLMSVSYLPVLRLYRLSALRAPSLPLIAALYVAMTVSSAWRYHAGRGTAWKGRTIR
jgi:hopene-associated glycosyltransferase HpnB